MKAKIEFLGKEDFIIIPEWLGRISKLLNYIAGQNDTKISKEFEDNYNFITREYEKIIERHLDRKIIVVGFRNPSKEDRKRNVIDIVEVASC